MILKQLLEYLVASIVDRPEEIKIDHISTPKVELFYLSVAKADLGRLLGRRGHTVESIRRVIEAVGRRLDKETVVDVVES